MKGFNILKIFLFCLGFVVSGIVTNWWGEYPRRCDLDGVPFIASDNILIEFGCWTAGSDSFFSGSSNHNSTEATPIAIINYVLRHECKSNKIFTQVHSSDYVDPDLGQTAHTLEKLLRYNSGKTIVYFNAPGGLIFPSVKTYSQTVKDLDLIGSEYPRLRYLTEFLSKSMRKQMGTLSIPEKRFFLVDQLDAVLNKAQFIVSVLWKRSIWHAPAPLVSSVHDMLVNHSRQYDSAELANIGLRPPLSPQLYFTHKGDEAFYLAWFELFAAMAAQRDSKFVFVIPPQVQIPHERIDNEFEPLFVRKIVDRLSIWPNATVVDLSGDTDLYTEADLTWFHMNGISIKPGYLFFISGKLKQARQIISALMAKNIIQASAPPNHLGDTLRVHFPVPPAAKWLAPTLADKYTEQYLRNTPQFLDTTNEQ